MNVLLACEESQAVTLEFRKRGHRAYSCDLIDCSGGYPKYHIKGDAIKVAKFQKWHKIISFPPCTDLAVSGARWFKAKRENGDQYRSILFFLLVWEISDAVENPIGIMNNGQYVKEYFPSLHEFGEEVGFPWKPTQIIQPWQFGHGETKATCLWLKGLPKLQPTNIVEGREQRIWKMAPGVDRAKNRSKTYQGIAKAMAEQWG